MEEKELTPSDRQRYIVLAIYDIIDNKTRNAMVKCLEQFAVRVQKSCFEGYMTKAQYKEMMRRSSRLINEEEDSLRIYLLSDHTKVVSWGRGEVKRDDVVIY